MKLDRFVARHASLGRTRAKRLIAAGRVRVNGAPATDGHAWVDRFCHIELDRQTLQPPQRRLHLLVHKPVGILSATVDDRHPTIVELIDDPDRTTLHLAGRLDRATSGLMLLTNDGNWSKRIMDPAHRVPKIYRVETRDPIPRSAIDAFVRGFEFPTEGITTLPAELEILGERCARLTLMEGRYHQVKRMFHRIGNRVTALHREQIGPLRLDGLAPGAWRPLRPEEIDALAGEPPEGRHSPGFPSSLLRG